MFEAYVHVCVGKLVSLFMIIFSVVGMHRIAISCHRSGDYVSFYCTVIWF